MIYGYNPRPPQANPPITPHEFEMALASSSPCGNSCMFAPFHDCAEPLYGKDALDTIPKRKTPLAVGTFGREHAWGIQAQHSISVTHVVLYHFLIIAGILGFWGWWQARHPSDVQSAAVPVTTMLGLFSLFWSSAGFFKPFREPS